MTDSSPKWEQQNALVETSPNLDLSLFRSKGFNFKDSVRKPNQIHDLEIESDFDSRTFGWLGD